MAMGKILPIAFWFISRKGENMRFDLDAYGKVFPAQQPKVTTDSAVDGYNPTADEANGKAQTKVESAVEDGTTQPDKGAKGLLDGVIGVDRGEPRLQIGAHHRLIALHEIRPPGGPGVRRDGDQERLRGLRNGCLERRFHGCG